MKEEIEMRYGYSDLQTIFDGDLGGSRRRKTARLISTGKQNRRGRVFDGSTYLTLLVHPCYVRCTDGLT
jgi:hypothetical protein